MQEAYEALKAAEVAYRAGEPSMSDAAYDAARDGLEVAWEQAGCPDGEIAEFLGAVAGGVESGSVPHDPPMLSLDKGTSFEEVTKWLGTLEGDDVVWVTPKLDGVALALRYVDGELKQAITRGTGRLGEDVTHNADLIVNLPNPDHTDFTGEVRGEAVMTDDDVAAGGRLRGEPYANRRNPIGPTLGRPLKDRKYTTPVRFVAYDVIGDSDVGDTMTSLGAHGFTTLATIADTYGEVYRPVVAATTATDVIEHALLNFENTRNPELPLLCDGAVLTVDSAQRRDELGVGTRTPKYAMAFKYPAEEAAAVLAHVDVAVGKSAISFTAVFESPVTLAGTQVTRATLHNPDFIAAHGLHIGDTVVVSKRGNIIPAIESVRVDLRPADAIAYVPPTDCPNCEGPLDYSQARPRCLNRDCSLPARLTHAVSRAALDLDGVGGSLIERAIDAGFVGSLADLFAIKAVDWASLEKVTAERSEKLEAMFSDALASRELNRWLNALGIKWVHESTGRRLAETFETLDAVRSATVDEIAGVDKLGPIKAESIFHSFQAMGDVLDALVELGLDPIPFEKPQAAEGAAQPFAGKKVLVTGKLGIGRKEAKLAVELLGGTATGSVSKTVDLVVFGEEAGPAKVAKASELGIEQLDSTEFERMAAEVLPQ